MINSIFSDDIVHISNQARENVLSKMKLDVFHYFSTDLSLMTKINFIKYTISDYLGFYEFYTGRINDDIYNKFSKIDKQSVLKSLKHE
jgi:hypothetical protein